MCMSDTVAMVYLEGNIRSLNSEHTVELGILSICLAN